MRHTLVQRIVRIGFEEEVLQADHYRVEVEYGLPVFSKNVQADISLQVDIRVVDLESTRIAVSQVPITHMTRYSPLGYI